MALELKASRPHNALLAAVVVAMLLLIAGAALTSSHVVGLRKLRVTVSQVSALTAAEESGGASHGIKVADYLFLSYRGDGPNDTTLLTKSCGNVLGGSPSAVWQRQHKLVSVLIYMNEEDLMNVRFLEHYDAVDWFVMVEAPFTFTGNPKPLHFGNALCRRFAAFADKVVHVVADFPDDVWRRLLISASMAAQAAATAVGERPRLCSLASDPRQQLVQPDAAALHAYALQEVLTGPGGTWSGRYLLWKCGSGMRTCQHKD